MAQSSDCQWQACSGGHTGPRRPARLRRSSGPAARPGAVPSEQSPTCAGVGFRVLGGSSVARITPVQDWVYEPGTVAGTGPGNRDSGNRCSCQFLLRPRAGQPTTRAAAWVTVTPGRCLQPVPRRQAWQCPGQCRRRREWQRSQAARSGCAATGNRDRHGDRASRDSVPA